MNKTPFWRRRYVVNWSLQARYAFVITLFSAFGVFAWGSVFVNAYALTSSAELSPPVSTSQVLLVALLGLVFVIVATGLGLVLSNRWAGPLFRMERYLKQLAEGELPPIYPLRKGDELHTLFSTFRAAGDYLRLHQQQELEVLERTLGLLEKGEETEARQAAKQSLLVLAQQMRTRLGENPST